jgi:hypothetical protein
VSASEVGITFHPLFDTDWKADLSNLEQAATSVAVSPDARLWAVALADGRLLVGLAPDEQKSAFLPVRRLESGGLHHLAFSRDNAFLLALGQNGVCIYYLDWNLEVSPNRVWDKKSELILQNFLASQPELFFTEDMFQVFLEVLYSAGLPGHDPQTVKNRLTDALERQRREY